MGATNQGYANLANTILAMQRLGEVEKEGISRQALRREQAITAAEKATQMRQKTTEEQFKYGVQSATGLGLTPESEGAFSGTRQLFVPGAETTEMLPPSGETTPGGFKYPGQPVLAPPSRQTVQESFRKEGEQARQDTLASLGIRGYGEGHPLSIEAGGQAKIPLSSTVPTRIKEYEESLGRQATLGKTLAETAEITGREAAAKLKRPVEQKIAETTAQRGEIGARRDILGERKETVDLAFQERLKQLETQKSGLERDLLTVKVWDSPIETATKHANLAKLNQDIAKSKFDFENDITLRNEIDRTLGMPEGEDKQAALRNIGTLKGESWVHGVPVMLTKAYLDASKQAVEGGLAADVEFTKGNTDAAIGMQEQANKWHIAASNIQNQPMTTIKIINPTGGGVFGGAPTQHRIKLKTDVARLWSDKTIDKAAESEAGVPDPQTGKIVLPDFALYTKVKIEQGVDASMEAYARAVNKATATPETKQRALRRFQVPDLTMQPGEKALPGEGPQPGAAPAKPRTISPATLPITTPAKGPVEAAGEAGGAAFEALKKIPSPFEIPQPRERY